MTASATESRPVLPLVDDNPAFLRIARAVFESSAAAFDVRTATTGEQALAALLDGMAPDLVVLDFHLPDTTAPALLRDLRRHAATAAIPVLVMTQIHWPDDEAAAIDAGARAFRVKPSSPDALCAVAVEFWAQLRGAP